MLVLEVFLLDTVVEIKVVVASVLVAADDEVLLVVVVPAPSPSGHDPVSQGSTEQHPEKPPLEHL